MSGACRRAGGDGALDTPPQRAPLRVRSNSGFAWACQGRAACRWHGRTWSLAQHEAIPGPRLAAGPFGPRLAGLGSCRGARVWVRLELTLRNKTPP